MSQMDEDNDWGIGHLSIPRACKAMEGYSWLKRAYKIFSYQPVGWMSVIFFISIVSIFSSILFQSTGSSFINMLGGLFVLYIFQIISAGLFVAAHRCEQDQYVDFACIFSGFSKCAKSLFIFSVIYFIAILAVDKLCHFLLHMYGSDIIEKVMAMTNIEEIQKALLDPATQNEFMRYSIIWMLLILSLAVLFGFAPALIIFHNTSPIEAIKLSMLGVVRNMNGLGIYGLFIIGISIIFSIVITVFVTLFLIFFGKAMGILTITLLFMTMMYWLLTITWISMYAAYSDIFWLRNNEISA